MPEKVEITVWGYRCERCGHEWVPIRDQPPRVCPKCKSPYWDRPRRSDATVGATPEPAPLRRVKPGDGIDAPKPEQQAEDATSFNGPSAAHRRAAARLRQAGDEDAARFEERLADEIEEALRDG